MSVCLCDDIDREIKKNMFVGMNQLLHVSSNILFGVSEVDVM